MTRTDDTIEQLRFLAENWHRFSSWTRLQIILTVWWYVKVRRPVLRLTHRLKDHQKQFLVWLVVMLLFGLSFMALAQSVTRFQPQLALLLALMSAVFLFGLGVVQNGK